LHPSHHYYMEDCCAVSGASEIATPLGNLPVDDALRQELLRLQRGHHFSIMTQAVDEAEHSGEMQYPYLAKVIAAGNNHNNNNNNNKKAIQVLPIMCGNLSVPKEAFYGNLLAKIIARPQVLCVISTDFCHWGRRFSYQPTATTSSSDNDGDDDSGGNNMEIHEFIQQLDHKGMEHIELQQPGAFAEYLKQTRNTICGRHAVQVWLHAVQKNNAEREDPVQIQFVKYAQSSPAKTLRDSSVSYASAVAKSQR
jgi:MEMO1 family protein